MGTDLSLTLLPALEIVFLLLGCLVQPPQENKKWREGGSGGDVKCGSEEEWQEEKLGIYCMRGEFVFNKREREKEKSENKQERTKDKVHIIVII